MIDKIRSILRREIERLDERSQAGGLDMDDIRTLDILAKVYRAVDGKPSEQNQSEPAHIASTEELLKEVLGE